MSEDKKTTPPASNGGALPPGGAVPCTPKRKVIEIVAKVPTTQSARGANAIPPPNTHHIFRSTSKVKPLATNNPTVLVRNSEDVELEVTTDPPNQSDVVWSVDANPGPSPTPVLTPSGTKATLKLDAAGGYAITATLDGDVVVWNLVLVEIKVNSSVITRNSGNFTDRSGGSSVGTSSGVFDVTNPAVCAMHASATIEVTAGGEASLDIYCDRVTVGMVNILLNDTAACEYEDGKQERERIHKTSGLPSPVVDPAVVVVDLGYPILDRGGNAATRATGGDTIFLSKTRSTPPNGKARVVETCDSPAVGFDAIHPEFNAPATKKATKITGVNSFSLHLVAYSADANFTYVTWGTTPWTADYSGTIAFTAAGPTWTKSASTGVTGAGASFTLIQNGKPSKDAGTEVRPPVFLDYIIDAR